MKCLVVILLSISCCAHAADVAVVHESCKGQSYAKWTQSKKAVSDDFNAEVIRAGWATTQADAYLGYQDEAIAEGAGIWACKVQSTYLFEKLSEPRNIHPSIVYSVAMTESGRNGKPWPWTINFAGKSFYYKSRIEAWQAASWLVSNGHMSFDIGLMQVNWKYHGWRFASLWEAFQPSVNIAAAIDFLHENYQATGSWVTAVKWYHNRKDQERGRHYLSNFYRHFKAYLQRD